MARVVGRIVDILSGETLAPEQMTPAGLRREIEWSLIAFGEAQMEVVYSDAVPPGQVIMVARENG